MLKFPENSMFFVLLYTARICFQNACGMSLLYITLCMFYSETNKKKKDDLDDKYLKVSGDSSSIYIQISEEV